MPGKKAIRYVVVPVALLSLLVLATLGCVWHHHTNAAATNCSVCHLSHQAFERPLVSDRAPALEPVGARLEPREPEYISGPTIVRIPARAPPAA